MEGTIRLPSPGEIPALRYLWEHGTARPRTVGERVYDSSAAPHEYAAVVLHSLWLKGLADRSPLEDGSSGSCYSARVTPMQIATYLRYGSWNGDTTWS